MPRNNAMLVTDYPPETVFRILCDKCGRRGQYTAWSLRQRYPDEDKLPALTEVIADGCGRLVRAHAWDRCGARWDGSQVGKELRRPRHLPETQKAPEPAVRPTRASSGDHR